MFLTILLRLDFGHLNWLKSEFRHSLVCMSTPSCFATIFTKGKVLELPGREVKNNGRISS